MSAEATEPGASSTAAAGRRKRGRRLAVLALVAVAIGTPLGLLIARVRLVRRGLGPFISGLQSLPSVAWVPAAIIFLASPNRSRASARVMPPTP